MKGKKFSPMKVFCKNCNKKYIKTGQYQRICEKCLNKRYPNRIPLC